jgi:two-component system LytT family sensor kinase
MDINKGKMAVRRKGLSLILHSTGWIILFILPQFLIIGGGFENIKTTLIIFFNTLTFGIIFYVNYLWLVPWFVRRGKWFKYMLAALTLIVLVSLASNFAFRKAFPMPPEFRERMRTEQQRDAAEGRSRRRHMPAGMAVYNYFITAFLVTGFAVGLRFAESSVKKSEEIKELEKEKLNSELALLKNQVSPHFFFNTLNNIYSLIAINQSDAQEAVLSLSKMMRYMLYESEQGNTKLSREIEFMQVYIDLMKLRISDRVRLTVDFPDEYEDIDIPPLLFIPFIENAFKYGVSYQRDSFISIALSTEEDLIRFRTSNSFNAVNEEAPQPDSGIGLDNVRKRLALLYPGKNELTIIDKYPVYSVELTINTGGKTET